MKTLLHTLLQSLLATAVLGIICCGIYPAVVTAAARLCFPAQSRGSLVYAADGVTVRGSRLLAQEFTSAGYFHPRPSAAGTGYDATSSGGTNYGPTSAKLAQEMTDLIAAYRKTEGLEANAAVPADAVTRSGSGLDPEISVSNARLQAARVARNRSLSLAQVMQILDAATRPRDLGAFGEPGVNVLAANLALDQLQPVPHP